MKRTAITLALMIAASPAAAEAPWKYVERMHAYANFTLGIEHLACFLLYMGMPGEDGNSVLHHAIAWDYLGRADKQADPSNFTYRTAKQSARQLIRLKWNAINQYEQRRLCKYLRRHPVTTYKVKLDSFVKENR